ncbi:MAG TPA: hypothetical protein VGF22_18315 [Acidimicrobiales bacterium]|jgi:hypothetical protein
MRIIVESTTKTVTLDGVPARIWEGHTDSGIALHCYITRIAVHEDDDRAQFEAELEQHQPPRNADIDAISNRLIL